MRKIIISLILLFGVIISGCVQEEEYTEPVEKLIIAEASQPIGSILYVAYVNGYFEDEGLDVEMKRHTSGRDAINTMLAGEADLAEVADIPIMYKSLEGEDFSIISTISTSGKNIAIVARKDKGISSPNDILGKRVAVTLGSGSEFFLNSFILAHGINDVESVNNNPEEMFDALMNGEVDAVSTWNPHVINLEKALGDNGVVFFGDTFYKLTWNIVGKRNFIYENPEKIKKVVRALVMAEKFIQKNRDTSKEIVAAYLNLDISKLPDQWDTIDLRVSLSQFSMSIFESEARWAIKNNLTSTTEVPNYLDYIYFDALEEVNPGAVTIIR